MRTRTGQPVGGNEALSKDIKGDREVTETTSGGYPVKRVNEHERHRGFPVVVSFLQVKRVQVNRQIHFVRHSEVDSESMFIVRSFNITHGKLMLHNITY